MWDKIVIVTRKTRLEEILERHNTRGQAKFYLEHSGQDYSDYEREYDTYHRALHRVREVSEIGLTVQAIDRSFVPNFVFSESDMVVTLGQDGMVANVAKYLKGNPVFGVNPDPDRFDGILLPFTPQSLQSGLRQALGGALNLRSVTLGEVSMNDGQRLFAFNDFFIGAKSHVSARYQIEFAGQKERHSSSGVIVSTGAGSTGWLSSVYRMAAGITSFTGGRQGRIESRFAWEDPKLCFAVREPFVSKHSGGDLVAGFVEGGRRLKISSLMPSGGVVFSDGIEADFLEFNSGKQIEIFPSNRRANLVAYQGGDR